MVGFCYTRNMADVSNFIMCDASVWKVFSLVDRSRV